MLEVIKHEVKIESGEGKFPYVLKCSCSWKGVAYEETKANDMAVEHVKKQNELWNKWR